MALKNFSNETMLAFSLSWTDPTRDRPALEASAAAPLLPELDEAHAELMAKRSASVSGVRTSSVARARDQWIRVVLAIAQAIALDFDARLDGAFVMPLCLAEVKADRKARGACVEGEADEGMRGEADEGAAV